MFLNLGFPLGTLMFLSVSLVMYFFKKKYNDFQNRLFVFLSLLTFVLLFLEIAYIHTIKNMSQMPFLNEFVCRSFLTGVIAWVVLFSFYIISIGLKDRNDEKKDQLTSFLTKLLIMICILLGVADCFFKIDYMISDVQYAIVGPAAYFVYGVVGVSLITVLVIIIKDSDKYLESLRIPLIFSLFLVLADSLHLFFYNINDLTLILSLVVCSLYFTIESQDRLLLKEVEVAKDKSEEVNAAKTDFLSNMSHEIRTPMNTILGFSNSLLSDDNLTKEKVMNDAKSINEASNNLLGLINNILEISRIESKREEITIKEYKLIDLVKSINETLISKVQKDNNWFDIKVNEKMPSSYEGDYSKICKIVNSVIINAVKYTSFGYISVNIDFDKGNSSLEIIVTNSGCKIPFDYYNSDFSDFSKLDYTHKSTLDSEFLGLVIAKRLLSMFSNSSILFEKVDETTQCTIKLSQKVVSEVPVGTIKLDEQKLNEKIDCQGKKVLIVDDNDLNIKIAEKLLKNYNFEVANAMTGNECIDLVKLNNYDLILLDHMMPEMDGVKTLEVLRSLKKDLPPIIVMTANSNVDSKDYYEKIGFDNYVAKPINKNRLDELIYEYFGGQK